MNVVALRRGDVGKLQIVAFFVKATIYKAPNTTKLLKESFSNFRETIILNFANENING